MNTTKLMVALSNVVNAPKNWFFRLNRSQCRSLVRQFARATSSFRTLAFPSPPWNKSKWNRTLTSCQQDCWQPQNVCDLLCNSDHDGSSTYTHPDLQFQILAAENKAKYSDVPVSYEQQGGQIHTTAFSKQKKKKPLKPYSGPLCYFSISDNNFSTSFYSELNMMRNIKLVRKIIHPNYFFCWRIIMANHRRPYSWKVICTHLTAVACPSLTQYVRLREPQRPAVFHILCQTYSVRKFLHDSICNVSRGLWVGRPPKFIFTLVPLMSPALLYAT
jgi:hypothetical protein